jgi:hypothetical protein
MPTRAYGRHLCWWEMAARSGNGFASHRAAMRCGGMRKMSIEHGCDAANQEFRAVAGRKPVVGQRHGAVCDEALDPRPIDDRGSRVAAVQSRHPGQIDRKIAHDPLDDVGAGAVFW